VTVSSNDKRAEAEPAPALDYLGGPIDEDHLLGEIVTLRVTIIVGSASAPGPISPFKPSPTVRGTTL
jgi:hypothetical protein